MKHSKEFLLKDKTKIVVRFSLYESYEELIWEIYDVLFKKPRKKKWISLKPLFADKYDYRQLSLKDRKKYEFDYYKEFCGEEILKAAYQDVYDRMKPDILMNNKKEKA